MNTKEDKHKSCYVEDSINFKEEKYHEELKLGNLLWDLVYSWK